MPDLISSASNPLVKRIRLLADRRHRRREGAFVVQGIQPVWQAVEAGAEIETLVVAPDLLRSAAATRMVAQQQARGVRVARVTADLFARIADRDGPTGLAAIVRSRMSPLDQLTVDRDRVFLALHEIGNPGNLGTIIRTADAVGDTSVVLVGAATDPFDPTAVKASMGAIFHVPVAHTATVDQLFGWAERHRIAVATTSARAPQSFWQADYPRPVTILLGSEGTGLPPEILDRGQLRLHIPMSGHAGSLNLAVAAGLLLYEARRKAARHTAGDRVGAGGPPSRPVIPRPARSEGPDRPRSVSPPAGPTGEPV